MPLSLPGDTGQPVAVSHAHEGLKVPLEWWGLGVGLQAVALQQVEEEDLGLNAGELHANALAGPDAKAEEGARLDLGPAIKE